MERFSMPVSALISFLLCLHPILHWVKRFLARMLGGAAFTYVVCAQASEATYLPPFNSDAPWVVRFHGYSSSYPGRHVWLSSEAKLGMAEEGGTFISGQKKDEVRFPCTITMDDTTFYTVKEIVRNLKPLYSIVRYKNSHSCRSDGISVKMSLQHLVEETGWTEYTFREFPFDEECLKEPERQDNANWAALASWMWKQYDANASQCYAPPFPPAPHLCTVFTRPDFRPEGFVCEP